MGFQLVSVLFTDIEGSTRLWEDHAGVMAGVLAEHDRLLRAAIGARGGRVFSTAGDSFAAVFPSAQTAVEVAVAAQLDTRGLLVADEPILVRMAVHSGEVEARGEGFFGPELNRCGRLRDAAHGGQVLVSLAAEQLLAGHLPEGMSLRDVGEHRLRDLSRPERVFQLCHPDLEVEFPPLRSLGGVFASLPVQVTSFVGRVEESAELEELIGSSRLVTITGSGGYGKSRLAVQVAAELMDKFPDGVCLVELAPLTDPELLASTVAAAVGMREQSGPVLDALTGYLRSREILVILDNCEHLVEAAADLVAHVLSGTPDVRVLATSREPLHIRGETVYQLPTLQVPEPGAEWDSVIDSDAVRLFADRAQAASPGFIVTQDNAAAVASVCAHLDGIPLAVELAASVSRLLSPAQIEQRLDDRFRLLTGGARDDVDHHRTLEAAIDWSYQLLTPDQQNDFARLGLFAGAFSVAAAEAVCADEEVPAVGILENIVQLADRSLLEVDATGPKVRYRMLETIHAFATARFGELRKTTQRDLAERHCRYFLSIAERATEGPISTATTWPAELDAATPDLRRALTWATNTGHDQYAVDLAGALGFYWHVRGQHAEALHWFQSIPLHSTAVTDRSRIRALRFAASRFAGPGAGEAVDVCAARDLADEALHLARQTGDPALIAASLHTVGAIGFLSGDPRTISVLEEGLELAELSGDRWRQANIRHFLALCYRDVGFRDRDAKSVDAARALFEKNLQVARELGDERLTGFTLNFLGVIAYMHEGDLDEGRRLEEESLAIGRKLDDDGVIDNALQYLGQATYLKGDLDTARTLHQEMADRELRRLGREDGAALVSLGIDAYAQGDLATARDYFRRTMMVRSGQPDTWEAWVMRRALWGLGRVLAREDDTPHAAVVFAAVDAATDVLPPWIDQIQEPADYQECVALIESTLPPKDLRKAQQQGAAMTLDQATDYALSL